MIFIHPDGAGIAHWSAARFMSAGPDGELVWDTLPHIAVYRGHMKDSISGTSHGGATAHAFGRRVGWNSFGMDTGVPIDRGARPSVVTRALAEGLRAGLVNTGIATEPGTAAFVARVVDRKDHASIATQLVESGAQVILGGGEKWFLPKGTRGVHGQGAREDGVDLVERARSKGYVVVRTREELAALSAITDRVLGLFASDHTFNDLSEEELRARGLPEYAPGAPTVAEMTAAAIRLLERDAAPFVLVVEEEGSDNFGNANNARGTITALQRADDALGVARAFVQRNPRALMLVASDSDAGGMETIGVPVVLAGDGERVLPERSKNGAPLDGRDGTGTPPFLAAPDREGRRLPFAVAWSTNDDVSGGILCRAAGYRAELVHGSIDNTEIHDIMSAVLFAQPLDRSRR
ncbi:MAG: alkaline phosphatase [Acidobacteria bacterium]|nr:alkaline phosphatase [Acidobacteriota bacterium]